MCDLMFNFQYVLSFLVWKNESVKKKLQCKKCKNLTVIDFYTAITRQVNKYYSDSHPCCWQVILTH